MYKLRVKVIKLFDNVKKKRKKRKEMMKFERKTNLWSNINYDK